MPVGYLGSDFVAAAVPSSISSFPPGLSSEVFEHSSAFVFVCTSTFSDSLVFSEFVDCWISSSIVEARFSLIPVVVSSSFEAIVSQKGYHSSSNLIVTSIRVEMHAVYIYTSIVTEMLLK
jgi:hypothetical protein